MTDQDNQIKTIKGWACDICTSRDVVLYQDFYYCAACKSETDLVSEWYLDRNKK